MTYQLDTRVIANLLSESPDPALVAWIDTQPEEMIFISVVTLAEIKNAIGQVNSSKSRAEMDEWLINDLLVRFHGRISEINVNVTLKLGEITAHFQSLGLSFNTVDALNLAIAFANDHTFVTDRIPEFSSCGVRLFDPFQYKTH